MAKKTSKKTLKKTAKKKSKVSPKKSAVKKSSKKKSKKKPGRRPKSFKAQVTGAYQTVIDTIKGTDALRNKMERPGTSETE